MRKVILYMACSLDGFISSKDDSVDWLFHDQDYGYSKFIKSIDTIIMGRRAYDVSIKLGPWGWKDKKTYVFLGEALHKHSFRSSIAFFNIKNANKGA